MVAYAGAVISTCAGHDDPSHRRGTDPCVRARAPRAAAANVALGWLDGAATLVGPAIAALTLTTVGSYAPFMVFGVLVAVAAIVTFGLPERPTALAIELPGLSAVTEPPPVLAALGEVAHTPGPRSVLLVLAARAFSDGALDLIYVVVAVEVLHGSSADAGWLYTMYGAGAARRRGRIDGPRGSQVALARGAHRRGRHRRRAGMSRRGALGRRRRVRVRRHRCRDALLLIASRTLLQRVTDLRLLCHAFSLAEASDTTMLMVGSLSVPLVVASCRRGGRARASRSCSPRRRLADRWYPAPTGARNAPIAIIELLRRSDIFGLLSAPALETLAAKRVRSPLRRGR